jgi:glycosyltransferase involved in cell wall biosynthesis
MDLSIIIPTYNRNQKVGECIQALAHNDAEILVIDDGSSTPVEVPRAIRLIRHDSNRGRAASINTGLRAASHDVVLVIDDSIYASPDMVVRLIDEFVVWNNPKLALVGRVVWDPDVRMTSTMRWMEESGPFHDVANPRSGPLSNLTTCNTVFWRPFILEAGGFDESFSGSGLEDIELGLRLRKQGLETRLLSTAVGFHNRVMRVQDLVARELKEGRSAVYLHSKFPDFIPQVGDVDNLMKNLEREKEVLAAVEELTLLETSDSNRVPSGAADLFMLVYRHYFLQGIVNGLADRGSVHQNERSNTTLAIYHEASYLESAGELSEARRMFTLVRQRDDSEYWAGAEYHLGVIETNLGNPNAARLHFEDCLTLNPEHEKAREALLVPVL